MNLYSQLIVLVLNQTMLIMLFSLAILQFPLVISDFSESTEIDEWKIVNDGVMGGRSEGELIPNSEGHVTFKGDVSLKNNGGFTSIRKSFESRDIGGAQNVFIKLKGDQKQYQFRTKNEQNERHVYKYTFETSGNWETVVIPLNDMIPTFRGTRPDLPNYQAQQLGEIGFLIANEKNENFELLIEKIWLN